MSTPTDDAGPDGPETERERATFRRHETYEKDHWLTTHVDRVDKIGCWESARMSHKDDRRARECLRVDLDGRGHYGADTHAVDENLQVSVFLTPEMALELLSDLQEQVAKGFTENCRREVENE
jgi:hypothetical protein